MDNKKKKFKIWGPSRVIPLSFIAAITIGTLLLLLPFSTAAGETTDFLTALFTATTSVCVTGLVVVDTYAHWSLIGKIIILCLIQIGGLGIVTVMAAFMLSMKKRFSLTAQLILQDTFNLNSLKGLLHFLGLALNWTVLVEFIGALLYMPAFIPRFGIGEGIWQSFFTSISAFCNAGIDIMGPDSLISYQSNPLVLLNTCFLIVTGGIGYFVLIDMHDSLIGGLRKKFDLKTTVSRFSVHTKLVLSATFFLIFGGALIIFLCEYSNPGTIGNMSLGDKILNSIFQSVTFRTAGFASVPQNMLRSSTALLGCVMMFVGGSPVGTAGGVKTVVLAVVIMNAVSYIRSVDETVLFNRRVNKELIRRANAIVVVALMGVIVHLFALLCVTDVDLLDGLYEVVSAICTVGLSRNLTAALNSAGRIVIIVCMYLGRIGPISMAIFFRKPNNEHHISRAEGKFIVG